MVEMIQKRTLSDSHLFHSKHTIKRLAVALNSLIVGLRRKNRRKFISNEATVIVTGYRRVKKKRLHGLQDLNTFFCTLSGNERITCIFD